MHRACYDADLDPDPAFYCNADLDPAFNFNVDLDPNTAPQVKGICDHWPMDPPGLHFEPPGLL